MLHRLMPLSVVLARLRRAAHRHPRLHLNPHAHPRSALFTVLHEVAAASRATGMAAHQSGTSMATTLVACVLRYDRVVVAHVGDSRCYLIRHGRAETLTRDHTLVNEQVRLGVLSARQAAGSESRHLLSRSVGAEMFVSAETAEHLLLPGDILLLCSDGLHASVQPSEIATLVAHTRDLNESAQKLVDVANERDGSDNISVQLIRVLNVERVGMYRGRPYKLR